MRRIAPEPLTGAAFSPFGEVIEHCGEDRRRHLVVPFEAASNARRFAMWVTRADAPSRLPLRVRCLERHRFTAQTFIPLSAVRYLVVVAPGGADDGPDLEGIRAFVAAPGQGVSYRRGTWHHGLTVLDEPGDFAVTMGMRGDGRDDEFRDLAAEIEIGDEVAA